jgi:hypothetical protein
MAAHGGHRKSHRMLSIRTRVRVGARLLDRTIPDWPSRIVLLALDLDDAYGCVLGQLFGDQPVGGPGYAWVHDQIENHTGLHWWDTDRVLSRAGFNFGPDWSGTLFNFGPGWGGRFERELHAAWVDEIEGRLAAAAVA